MTKFKIWMVALTALMGVSFTSCFGSGDTIKPVSGFITVKSILPYQFQVEGSDIVYEANSMTVSGLSESTYPGDIVYLEAQYDTSTQKVDQNTKKIIVTVIGATKLNEEAYSVIDENVPYNRSVITTSNDYSYHPGFYSKNWLLMRIAIYVEKQEWDNVLEHSFSLVYDEQSNTEDTMVLRLRHQSREDATKEKYQVNFFKAFRITNFVNTFNNGSTVNKLKTIKIIIQEQGSASSTEITEGSTDNYTEYTYTLDYSQVANL